jgi:hypothetical protein
MITGGGCHANSRENTWQTALALLQGERLQSRPEAQPLFELDQERRK